MKNYEQKIDRLIQSLKEAKDILTECNVEMAKSLKIEKETIEKYVLFDRENEAYVMGFHVLVLGRLQDAKLFDSELEATNTRSALMQDGENEALDLIIRKVKIKAVE